MRMTKKTMFITLGTTLVLMIGVWWIKKMYFTTHSTIIYIPDSSSDSYSDTAKVELEKNQYIYKAKVRLEGVVDGDFDFNGQKISSGKIDTTVYFGDWYQPQYSINYKSIDAQEGKLKVKVTFYSH